MARKPKSETPNSRIALLREERGWTQEYLGEKMFVSGRTIGDIEKGKSRTIENYIQLADLFEVSLDYLLERSEIRTVDVNGMDELDHRAALLFKNLKTADKERIIKHLELEIEFNNRS